MSFVNFISLVYYFSKSHNKIDNKFQETLFSFLASDKKLRSAFYTHTEKKAIPVNPRRFR